jgi:hypothetical protein
MACTSGNVRIWIFGGQIQAWDWVAGKIAKGEHRAKPEGRGPQAGLTECTD